jgi:DNA-binding NtrC family response regulator
LAKHCGAGDRPTPEFAPEALAALASYRWPGNVRQLDNEMQRLAATVRSGRVEQSDLSDAVRAAGSEGAATKDGSLKDAVESLERRLIADALDKCTHNRQQTAKALGLSRQGLIKKLKRYGLTREKA